MHLYIALNHSCVIVQELLLHPYRVLQQGYTHSNNLFSLTVRLFL